MYTVHGQSLFTITYCNLFNKIKITKNLHDNYFCKNVHNLYLIIIQGIGDVGNRNKAWKS